VDGTRAAVRTTGTSADGLEASGEGIDGGMSVPPVATRGDWLAKSTGGTLELYT
jgi:hypothetical protein